MKRSAPSSSGGGPATATKAARTVTIDSIAASCQEIVRQLPHSLSLLPATATSSPSSAVKHKIRAILSHLLTDPTPNEAIGPLAVALFRSLPSWRDSAMFHFASPPVEVWNLLMRSNQLELLYHVLHSLPPPLPALQTLVDNLQRLWTESTSSQQAQGADSQRFAFRITALVVQRNSGIKAILDRPSTFLALCDYLTQAFANWPADSSFAFDTLSTISLLIRHAQELPLQAPALSLSLSSPTFIRSLHRLLAGRAQSLIGEDAASHAQHASALGRCLTLCKQIQSLWSDSLAEDAASSFVGDLCAAGAVLFPTPPSDPGGHAPFRALFLPFLQVLAALLPKATNGPSLVRDSGLVPQLIWLFSTMFVDPNGGNELSHDGDRESDSHFAASTLYLADYDLSVQLARVLVHLCQAPAIGPAGAAAAPKSVLNLFARRLVDSVCLPVVSNRPLSQPSASAPPVIVVRRSSTTPPREHKRALFSKCLKLLSLLFGKWEVATPIIRHGLVPLVRRLARYPHEPEVVPDPTEVDMCCLCTRHLAESSLLRLRVRDSAELTQLWSTLVGHLATFTLENGQSAAVSASAIKQLAIAVDQCRSDTRLIDPLSSTIGSLVATHFQSYMSRNPCRPADADLDQHHPLASLLLSLSHGPSFSRTPNLALQLMPSLLRVPRFASRLVSLWFQRSPDPLDMLIQLVTSVISLDMQLVIGSRTDWFSRILDAFDSHVVPSKRANWLSSVVAFWIQSHATARQPPSSYVVAQPVHLSRTLGLSQLHDLGSIVGFALVADRWLSRPYRDPIPTSDMWAQFAHGCVHQAQDLHHPASILCADGIQVHVCRSCFAQLSGYFAGMFLDGFLESLTDATARGANVSMGWLPADLLRDTVDFAFSGQTAGQWWPSEDSNIQDRVHTLVEMVLLADRIVAPTIQLACLELLFACLNPTSRFVAERFPIATPPAWAPAAHSIGSYPSAWSPVHPGSQGSTGYGPDFAMPSYSPSPPGSPISISEESTLTSSTTYAIPASEPALRQVDPQVAQRSHFVGQVARAILEAYVSVTLEGWPAESCRVFQPLLLEAAAQLLVRYPVTLDYLGRHNTVPYPRHFDTLLLELCHHLMDFVV